MLGKAGLDFIAGGLEPEPHVPYGQTKEGQEGQWAHEKELAKIQASSRSSGGSKLPWSTSEPGIKYQKGMDYKMNKENNAARMAELQKQYALQKEQTSHEWGLGRKVFEDAAGAAAAGLYKSGRLTAGEAIVASQRSKEAAGALQNVANANIVAEDLGRQNG